MTDDRWRRPAIPTENAASAALRLAQGSAYDDFLRRDRPDGTIEVVGVKRGRLNHYLVHLDGTTELIETLEPPGRYRWGRRLYAAGLGSWPFVILAGFVFQPDNSVLWIGGAFFLGWLLVIVGALVTKGYDLRAYLRSRTGSGSGWTDMPYKLGGWPARSSLQLEAVKELSEEGEGEAHVRNRGDGVAEVVTIRDGHRYRHLVDATGVIVDEEIDQISRGQRWGLRLMKAGVVLFFFFVLALAASARIAVAGMAVSVLAWLVGRLLERKQRPHTVGEDRWFTLETAVPSD